MPSVPPPHVGDTARLALARLALDVVSTTPGVAGTDAGPSGLCVTADPPAGVLRGVAVIAQPDGRYEVDICVVARLVPLLPLGEEIRRRLRSRAGRAGLEEQLGTVNVEFSRALSEGEIMEEAPGVLPGEPPVLPGEPPVLPGEPPVLPGPPPPDPLAGPEGTPPGAGGSLAPPPASSPDPEAGP